jgi:hypothetical protein
MEDLSDLRLNARASVILQAFLPSTDSRKVRLYQHSLARLIDKAIHEYVLARGHLIAQIDESHRPVAELMKGRIIYMDGFTNHLENCINAVGRLFKMLDRLMSEQLDVPIPRELRRALKGRKELTKVRNAMEHMDEMIQRDELEEGTAGTLSLAPDQTSATIGSYSISFLHLAATLRTFHEIAHSRLKSLQTSSPTEWT